MPRRDDNITEKQAEVLGFIIDYVEEHGYQPTTIEMAAHFGVSVNAIKDRLKQLVEKQAITRMTRQERAITIKHVKYTRRIEI